MTIKEFEDFFTKKLNENESFIKITYYELRIKYNLTEDETNEFLAYSKRKFENLGYDVYFTGAKYTYQNINRIVENNELMIAIKSIS